MALSVSITKPVVGASSGTWGTILNTALDDLVAGFNTDVQNELDLKAALAGAAFTGNVSTTGTLTASGLTTANGGLIVADRIAISGGLASTSGNGSTVAPDLSAAMAFRHTLTGASAITISNPSSDTSGVVFWTLIIDRDGFAPSITWGSDYESAHGGEATLPANFNDFDSTQSVMFTMVTVGGTKTYVSWSDRKGGGAA